MSKEFLNEINEKEANQNESFQKEKFEKIKPDRSKYIVLALVLIALIVASIFFMNPKVTLEQLVGMDISDAKTWAFNNDVQLIQKDIYAPMESGTILTQSIEAGNEIKAKSTITVEVSLGYDPNEVINLPMFDDTWTKTKIIAWLNENQLENFTLVYEETLDKEPNLYLSHTLPETTNKFLRSHQIEFTLTALPVEAEITVVDFLNFSTAQIDAWAKDNEILVKYNFAYSDTVQTNKVLRQSLSAGTIINPKDSILVTLSQGPAIKVIDFTSYDESAASAWAKENSIDLTTIKEYSSNVAKDVAIYQSLAKDSIVKTGENLIIYYSLGAEITIPSYVNQAFTNLQNFVETQNKNKAQLVLNVKYSHSSDVAKNKIIAQSIVDARTPIGSTIDVVVSLGDLVIVPSLTDDPTTYVGGSRSALQAYEIVMQACKSADIVCQIIFEDNDEKIGMVYSQSIQSGTQVSDSTVVEVVIYD